MRSRVRGNPERVGSILGRMVGGGTSVGRAVRRSSIWTSWSEIAGPIAAAHSYPKSLVRRTLYVYVEDSVWMHRLSFVKDELLQAINERLEREEVRRIEFCLLK